MLLYRVVIGFPAFQFLKAEKTLGQIRLVLGRAVDEASLRHSLWGAGAVLQEGPVLEGGDAVVLEVQLPDLGQRRSSHDGVTTTSAPGTCGSG